MSLLRTTLKGLSWTTISSIVRSLTSLVQVSLLTRYLPKEDFGLIAIASIFIGFSQIFMDMGISNGIMHKQDTTRDQYCSLFWLNIICGVVLMTILIIIAPFVSSFYDESMLTNVIVILGIGLFMSSLGIQQKIILQKQLRFRLISTIEIVSSFFVILVTFIMVELECGIYSMVVPQMLNVAIPSVVFLIIGIITFKHIHFHFYLNETYPYLKIGSFSVASNVLSFFSREADIMIMSTIFGRDVLGGYSLCKKIVTALFDAINPILSRVLMPIFASIQSERTRLKNAYFHVVEVFICSNLPIYILVAIFSYGILHILYGKEYINVAYIMSIISLVYFYLSSWYPIGSLLIALGRTDLGLYFNIYQTLIVIPSVLLGSIWGIEGVVLFLLFFYCLSTPVIWRITLKPTLGGKFVDYLRIVTPLVLIGLIVSLPFYLLCSTINSLLYIIALSFLFFLLYVVCIIVIRPNSYIVESFRTRFLPYLRIICKK